MKSPRLLYLITRVHGLSTHLLNENDYSMLASAKSIREIAENLLKGDYATILGKISLEELDAKMLERVFYQKLIERNTFLITLSPPRISRFLSSFFKRFEIENIKRIIKAKHGGETLKEEELIPIPKKYTLINFQALLGAKDVEETVSFLKETEYAELEFKYNAYRDSGYPIILEACLDEIYFRNLLETTKRLPNRKDVESLTRYLGEIKNLQNIVNLLMRKAEPKVVSEVDLKVRYKLSDRRVKELSRRTIEELHDVMRDTSYAEISQRVLESYRNGLVEDVSLIFEQNTLSHIIKTMSKKTLSLVYVLCYLLLCECEVRNLITVAVSRELGLTKEKIQERIII